MKKTCFVIMPFGSTTDLHDEKYWTDHFEKFLKPIIEENLSLEAKRSEPLRGDIVGEIINNLYRNPIVVAELTDFNPNVFWELGVRQSFKHGTITIAEEVTRIPFNISTKGTIFYSKEKLNDEKFKNNFCKALNDCLINPSNPDSIVLESISGRGTLFQMFLREETIRRLDGLISDLRWNEKIITEFHERAKLNELKKLKLYSISVEPLARLSSTELLLTNRYVDASKDFYEIAENYWMIVKALNRKMERWFKTPKKSRKEVIRVIPALHKISKDFENQVKNIKTNLIIDE